MLVRFRFQQAFQVQKLVSSTFPGRNEPLATDTVINDTPAIHDRSTMAQFLVSKDTLVYDAYGFKSQEHVINTI